MANDEIMVIEETVETVCEDSKFVPNRKGALIGVGVGLAAIGCAVAAKKLAKPIANKIKGAGARRKAKKAERAASKGKEYTTIETVDETGDEE